MKDSIQQKAKEAFFIIKEQKFLCVFVLKIQLKEKNLSKKISFQTYLNDCYETLTFQFKQAFRDLRVFPVFIQQSNSNKSVLILPLIKITLLLLFLCKIL
jgi:hypothetical protein